MCLWFKADFCQPGAHYHALLLKSLLHLFRVAASASRGSSVIFLRCRFLQSYLIWVMVCSDGRFVLSIILKLDGVPVEHFGTPGIVIINSLQHITMLLQTRRGIKIFVPVDLRFSNSAGDGNQKGWHCSFDFKGSWEWSFWLYRTLNIWFSVMGMGNIYLRLAAFEENLSVRYQLPVIPMVNFSWEKKQTSPL